MPSPIHHMTVIRYYRDGRHWDSQEAIAPDWSAVENAISQMDNYYFPIVQLNCTEFEDDDGIFNIVGGAGRFALFQMMGEWQYDDPNGSDEEVRLWDSDQGYFCKERNILADIKKVLRITRAFYLTGSYFDLDGID